MIFLIMELALAVCVAARPNNLEANGSEVLSIIADSVPVSSLTFSLYCTLYRTRKYAKVNSKT